MNRWIDGSIVLAMAAMTGLTLTNAILAGGWPNWVTLAFCLSFFIVRGALLDRSIRRRRWERFRAASLAQPDSPADEIPTLHLDGAGDDRMRGGIMVRGIPAQVRLVLPCPRCGGVIETVAATTEDAITLVCACGIQASVRLNIKRLVRENEPSAN